MNKTSLSVGLLGVLVVGAAGAFALWNWVLGPTLAASGPLTAVPLAITTRVAPSPAPSIVAPATTNRQVTAVAAAPASVTQAASPSPASQLQVLQISQDSSEVRFILTEVLRGQPTTVVGSSKQVAGEIAVDPSDLRTVQVGVIQVNARTLTTANNQRNQAIRNRILNTNTYEFITFTPTEIIGLAGSARPGDTFTFQIAGDLTIRAVTKPVVFDITAKVDSSDQLSGTAMVTINRSDFGLIIPSVRFVADVSEAVQLQIDFVAAAS